MLSAPLEIVPLLSQFLSQKLIKGLMLFPWKTRSPLALSSPLLKIPMSKLNKKIPFALPFAFLFMVTNFPNQWLRWI